jgi:transcriptional regulator with XRE-family HTH domain
MNTNKRGKRMLQQGSDGTTLEELGGRIRAARVAKGLRVNAVAKDIGVSRTTYSDWEAGHVKNPDTMKLGRFAELTQCSLDWLIKREGSDPDLTPPPKMGRRRKRRADNAPVDVSTGAGRGVADLPIAEIAAPMTAHARELNLTPRALWTIPQQVLEIGFNSLPENTVVHRVVSRSAADAPFARGDYLLVDISRTKIDEPGTYMIADGAGESACRAFVVDENGQLTLSVWTDDLNRNPPQNGIEDLVSLGRIMGIFKPV